MLVRIITHISFLLIVCFSCKQTSWGNQQKFERKTGYIAKFDLDEILARGYLIALMENSSTGLFVYKGETMGYEYELLKRYCNELGVELRIDITQNLREAFNKLNTGEGDIMAYNLTVTKERKKKVAFTHYHNLQHLVLVQRKPRNWKELKHHEIEAQLIRNPIDLIGMEIVVRSHSSYHDRLVNLSDEIGGDILIIPGDAQAETEQLIRDVAKGKIDFTIAEKNIAQVNATYYRNLDIETAISFPQQISWGVRMNATELQKSLNDWILRMRKTSDYYVIYDKYFRSSKDYVARTKSEFSTIRGSQISPYDSLIQLAASELGWDWKLLAAQIFKESGFVAEATSWAGAIGLMQVLPSTASDYGISNLKNPYQNILAGKNHLLWLQTTWENEITDPHERIKFILASYNVGRGHVLDAIRLTEKYGGDPSKWADVEEFLLKKSYSTYYNDPVVQYGYCRGLEPVQYVDDIFDNYLNYKVLIPQKDILIQ